MYEKSRVTITQILDAAQPSFVANNYNAITMTAYVRETNITSGASYHHFNLCVAMQIDLPMFKFRVTMHH